MGSNVALPSATPKDLPDRLDTSVPVRSSPIRSVSALEAVDLTVMRARVIVRPLGDNVAVTLASRTFLDWTRLAPVIVISPDPVHAPVASKTPSPMVVLL